MYQEAILKQTKIILIETKIATNFATVVYFNFDETTNCRNLSNLSNASPRIKG